VNSIAAIKTFYTPIQPTVKPLAVDVLYTEFFPNIQLQNFIYCYWQLQTTQKLSTSFCYRVVADGCVDIYLNAHQPEENYIMGFCEKFTEFPLGDVFNYVGIRFLPAAFPQLFKINAAELSHRFEALEAVVPSLSGFIAHHFSKTLPQTEIKTLFDQYFLDVLTKTTLDNDKRLYGAIELILKNKGTLHIEKDLETGISPRQLRRLFEFYIGDTAKTFSKVVRFQSILKTIPFNQSLNKIIFSLMQVITTNPILSKILKSFMGLPPAKHWVGNFVRFLLS